MSKPQKKKRRWIFPLVLVLYAMVFLGAAYYGLTCLWDYMEAYEASRPHIPLNAYMEQLTAETVCDRSQSLIDSIDHQVQSEESCRQVILQSLSGGITCAKKSSECTESYQLYVLKSGGKVIGTMEMTRQEEDKYGLAPWKVTGDSFDLSFLITQGKTVTVPSNYPVTVNGNVLGSAYITEKDIPYEALDPYYGQYALPTMVTYAAGPFLGESTWVITDPQGAVVEDDSALAPDVILDNCSEEETAALTAVTDGYIRRYVDFMSCTGGNARNNYYKLAAYLVPGGDLDKRMYAALDGLYWVSDRGAVTSAIDIHRLVNIGDGRYFCDVTYVVDTRDYTGAIQTANHLKIIFLSTEDGLKAETVTSY